MPRKRRKLDVVCPNPSCSHHNKNNGKNIVRYGKQINGTQRYKCTSCDKTFARTHGTPFFHKHLQKKEIINICKMLAEKTPFRGVARQTGHHLDTVRAIATVVARHCKQFNEYFIKELKLTPIEVDEMWSFVKKKKKNA